MRVTTKDWLSLDEDDLANINDIIFGYWLLKSNISHS